MANRSKLNPTAQFPAIKYRSPLTRGVLYGFFAFCSFIVFFLGGPIAGAGAYHNRDYNPPITAQKNTARVLHFPRDISLGELIIMDNGQDDADPEGRFLTGAARGDVKVAPNKIVILNAGHQLFRNPGLLDTFAPDAIDTLKLTSISLDDAEDGMCDRALAHVAHLTGLRDLNVNRSDTTDAGLMQAAKIAGLTKLSASYTMVRGSCIKQIATLKKLRVLRLSGIALKTADLKNLSVMPSLEYVTLGHTGLNIEGLRGVCKCPNLVSLDLAQNPYIDDRALKELLVLKKLRFLALNGDNVTAEGVKQLKSLPLVSIVLPASRYQKSVMQDLQKTFPRAELIVLAKGPVNKETRDLYAPIH